jgi:hypothetical protein
MGGNSQQLAQVPPLNPPSWSLSAGKGGQKILHLIRIDGAHSKEATFEGGGEQDAGTVVRSRVGASLALPLVSAYHREEFIEATCRQHFSPVGLPRRQFQWDGLHLGKQ